MLIPAPIHNCKLAAIDPYNVDVDPVAQNCSHVATAQQIVEGEAQAWAMSLNFPETEAMADGVSCHFDVTLITI